MLGATSSINNYPGVFGVTSGQSLEQLAQTLTTTAKQTMPGDSVSISSSAAMLQQFLNSEMQGGNGQAAEGGEMDLMGLAQLKQRGEMLASMLQLKMKDFESTLMTNVQGAGLPMQEMHLKNGDEGLSLLGDMPNKESLQNLIGNLQGEFSDISRLAEVLNMLQQMGPDNGPAALSSAAQYAQQSNLDRSSAKRPDSDFVMHIMQSGASFSFE
ncbi:MAG: hypothetical protein LBI05_07580 [Planctomycetaceae bacterium]|jgi:hypothetical protein|nr:hypothetical protein [Planctomycetaceae bacterium]